MAPCSRPTTNVIKPLHECKKVCPCTEALLHSGIRAWIKQGRRGKGRQGRQRPWGWWKERQPKTHWRNKNKAYLGTAKVRQTTNVIGPLHECRKCVHAQKPYSCEAFAHESSKFGGRGKKRDSEDRGQEADICTYMCIVVSLVTTIFTKIFFFWYDFLLFEDIHMTYLVWLMQDIKEKSRTSPWSPYSEEQSLEIVEWPRPQPSSPKLPHLFRTNLILHFRKLHTEIASVNSFG